jgi:SAM-dependent methyltransferase
VSTLTGLPGLQRVNELNAAVFGRMPLPAARRFAKRQAEIAYWRKRLALEGGLRGWHYERFFTTHFGLAAADYAGKRVLDVGCGPRGSLDWAEHAAERVGLDPLADVYERLRGWRAGGMRFVRGGAEAIPFGDAHFDVIASFNSLDHVDDVDRAIGEITRVAAPGAAFLLLTDVEHAPTFTEPQRLSWDLLDRFGAGWDVVERRCFENVHGTMMESLDAGLELDVPGPGQPGILSARLVRRG